MPQSSSQPKVVASLWRRRVRYPVGNARLREGFVIGHDRISGTVIVLDDFNGTFWRGPDADVEVIV
ncbi:hypothetical protein J2793_006232 [Paraburkholderia caledonica]|uniref:Uncharacterized protein n=1 Tax=Paraburkholderia caledonica TaxID=134536 RepID=A0AB73IL75_9BURK|nr:hypothetical protein [Paraburkholderia caledonica]